MINKLIVYWQFKVVSNKQIQIKRLYLDTSKYSPELIKSMDKAADENDTNFFQYYRADFEDHTYDHEEWLESTKVRCNQIGYTWSCKYIGNIHKDIENADEHPIKKKDLFYHLGIPYTINDDGTTGIDWIIQYKTRQSIILKTIRDNNNLPDHIDLILKDEWQKKDAHHLIHSGYLDIKSGVVFGLSNTGIQYLNILESELIDK